MKKLIITSILSLFLTISLFAKEKNETATSDQTRFESLTKLTKVIGTVEKYYVDDIKLQEIIDKAL